MGEVLEVRPRAVGATLAVRAPGLAPAGEPRSAAAGGTGDQPAASAIASLMMVFMLARPVSMSTVPP